MKGALAIAQADGEEEEEVELLVALALSVDGFGCSSGRGYRLHCFLQAEQKIGKLKSNTVKVIYFRARSSVGRRAGPDWGRSGL